MTTNPICPECQAPLRQVFRPSDSMLNEEQFDAVKAGDYFCESCKGDRARSGYRYFWNRELANAAYQPAGENPAKKGN